MNDTEKDKNLVFMNAETLQYFLKGLRLAIKRSGLKQGEWAEGVTSEVNLSNILRGTTGTSDKMREKLAKRAGMEVSEIVLLGKNSEESQLKEESVAAVPGIPSGHINPMDVLSATTTLVQQYQKNDERMRFWRTVFEELPAAAIIIRNDIVICQNKHSRDMGSLVGAALCDNCKGRGCVDPDSCPVRKAIVTGMPCSGYQTVGGVKYKVDIAPVEKNEDQYFIVLASVA